MAILNYTTTIAAHRSAGEVQHMLARAGAQLVTVEYDREGNPCAMGFRLPTVHGLLAFRLPARIDGARPAPWPESGSRRPAGSRLRSFRLGLGGGGTKLFQSLLKELPLHLRENGTKYIGE